MLLEQINELVDIFEAIIFEIVEFVIRALVITDEELDILVLITFDIVWLELTKFIVFNELVEIFVNIPLEIVAYVFNRLVVIKLLLLILLVLILAAVIFPTTERFPVIFKLDCISHPLLKSLPKLINNVEVVPVPEPLTRALLNPELPRVIWSNLPTTKS